MSDSVILGSSVHGIFQARILKWVAISFSRRSSKHRDWTHTSELVYRWVRATFLHTFRGTGSSPYTALHRHPFYSDALGQTSDTWPYPTANSVQLSTWVKRQTAGWGRGRSSLCHGTAYHSCHLTFIHTITSFMSVSSIRFLSSVRADKHFCSQLGLNKLLNTSVELISKFLLI